MTATPNPTPTRNATTGSDRRGAVADPELETAFAALRNYDWGSSRAALLPLDRAVAAAHASAAARRSLEKRLLDALQTATSVPAREYICAQLAVIGSRRSVPALERLLAEPALNTAARNALEAIPDPQTLKALRRALPRLPQREQIGVITSLGVKRDAAAVSALAKLLETAAAPVAEAAAWALGRIATPAAARALLRWLAQPGASPAAADSALACAARLLADGRRAEAETLCRGLQAERWPAGVRRAAEQMLENLSR